jgi:pimeloyl-ACP methyl ester carboxylesterase
VIHIESLLSARSFLSPHLVNDRIFFISNLNGRMSLFAMNYGGSVPEPLLPPNIALQNPHLMDGYSFYVYPKLGKILVMIDSDGDENYQPMFIPIEGGYPKSVYGEKLSNHRVHLLECDADHNLAYFTAESRQEQIYETYKGKLDTGDLRLMVKSMWVGYVAGISKDQRQAILIDSYTVGDHVLFHWSQDGGDPELLFGVPLEKREKDEQIKINSISDIYFTEAEGLLFFTSLFSDNYGLGYFRLDDPESPKTVDVNGIVHKGMGELEELRRIKGNRYSLLYNIDGCSWLYEGAFNEKTLSVHLDFVICGRKILSDGVLESFYYDDKSDRYILSFSTAISPTQIYSIEGKDRNVILQHTSERVLGMDQDSLSAGEDHSFTSFDGTRISSRLYLPPEGLGFTGPRPLIYYIHGGPQSQERPDFAWFSMPLIQLLTMRGFALFVPNVRGSSGYGSSYMKQVDRDWGGKDRLDHVYAMEKILPQDDRIDVSRAGVVGRSYGGYMTLTLAGRHPELWSSAVDMFGPYDLLTFSDRIPETWKPYFSIALGDPIEDKDFLIERSPRTYINNISFPMLVIQGKNDPRVIEQESRELVENLRADDKTIEYLVFEDEGHDVLKYENRVICYNAITEFFEKYLKP